MTANYWLLVKIEAEPDVRPLTKSELAEVSAAGVNTDPTWPRSARDYSRAAGTYVEIENSGDVCNFDATQLEFEIGNESNVFDPWPLGSGSPSQSLEIELPRVGRPIVLLAVPGGNQEFDRWSDETSLSICAGQGARCEVPEPAEDYGYTMFAKAVFHKKPDPVEIFGGPLDPSRIRRRLPEPPQEP